MQGQVGMRLPRLLFGEGAEVKNFETWHAELLQKLGPVLAEGICATWQVAGGPEEWVHIVLCATRTRLMLLDLNKKKERPFISAARTLRSKMKQRDLRELQRKFWKGRFRPSVNNSDGRPGWHLDVGFRHRDVLATLKPGMLSFLNRAKDGRPEGHEEADGMQAGGSRRSRCTLCGCLRRWKRREERIPEELLGAWSWLELLDIDFAMGPGEDSFELCVTALVACSDRDSGQRPRASSRTSSYGASAKKTGGGALKEEVVTKWPLLGNVVAVEELEVIKRDVRQGIAEMQSS